jgi:SNF2 family DNA or RNA helicase
MPLTLRPYQIEGCYFLAERRFALLADEMRVGKTPQAILAAAAVKAKRICVVCPAIAVPQWNAELQRWWRFDYSQIAAFGSDQVYTNVLSYDKARTTDFSKQERYDVAIVDECQYAKNPEAKRTSAIYGKNSLGWHSDRMWALSGTPVTKHAGEFWPMLVAFGATRMSYEQFCWHFCDYDWTKTKIVGTKQSRIPELRALLAPLMLRRTKKQVRPEMDDIGFQFLAIDCKKDLVGELEDDPTRKEVAIAKAPALVEEIAGCLERGDYKQTVVFAWHRDAIDAVTRGLWARGIDTEQIRGDTYAITRARHQQEFKDGVVQVLVCQIIAAGTAIDLSAASHGYFLELDWVPGNNMQAANRLVSMMKDEPVTFDICTAPGTIDDRVQRILLRRSQELRTIL